MKNIKDYILESKEKNSYNNYFESTVAVFDWIEERPDSEPNYISCYWGLYRPLKDGEIYKDYTKTILYPNIIYGKCYLKDFEKIKY